MAATPAYLRHPFLLVLPLGLVGLGACGPIIEQAPFSYRPDTMSPGDLVGPFDGIVVDAETDRPLAGAIVTGSWAFERGVGLTGPAGASEVKTETGADGRYKLPALDDMPEGASMRIRRFTLVVYQPGYVGWRSDRQFPEGTARRDFSQRGNRVRLVKWRDGLLHHQHLVFLGGGSAIRVAAQAEVQAAVMELEGRRPGALPGAPGAPAGPVRRLDATPLLSEDELRGVTGYAGEFDIGKLTDLPRTDFYDSRHFKARGQTEAFDVALRVWRLGQAGAEAQYRKLLGQLPGAVTADELGDASLRARAAEVLGVAFLARERGVVVSISCGIKQCPEMSMLTRLGKLVESHLPELDVVQEDDSTGLQGQGLERIGTPAAPAPTPGAPLPADGTGAPSAPPPAPPAPSPGPREDPLP